MSTGLQTVSTICPTSRNYVKILGDKGFFFGESAEIAWSSMEKIVGVTYVAIYHTVYVTHNCDQQIAFKL